MSSEKPPSIAPKRPAGSRGGSPVGRVTMPGAKPAVAGSATAQSAPAPAPARPGGDGPAGSPFGQVRPNGATPTTDAGPPAGADGQGSERQATPGARGPLEDGGPRRVRLSIARVDPWSVMKLSFLLSVAVGVMIVVAAAVMWQTLNNMAVFTQVNELIGTLIGQPDYDTVLQVASFERVISVATMIAVVDVVLLTALSTIMAFLYNIVAALVGGLHVTLTDD